MAWKWAPPNRYTLRCITASIMKDLIDLIFLAKMHETLIPPLQQGHQCRD